MIQSQAPVCDANLGKLGGRRSDCPRRTEMMRLLHQLFSSDFLPHGTCYLWNPRIVWLHVISDAVITLSYYCIPIALVYLARRRQDLPFNWIFWMFGMLIVGCGTTHLMEIWTIWHSNYFSFGFDQSDYRGHFRGHGLSADSANPEGHGPGQSCSVACGE